MWKIRVPVEKFDSLLAILTQLGELQQTHTESEDVTQEYYDIEARIANKQKEEKRLQKHLDESTGKLEDILAVERELTRVRGEIEQMQGRIRYLSNITALSTITLTATEIKTTPRPRHPHFPPTSAARSGVPWRQFAVWTGFRPHGRCNCALAPAHHPRLVTPHLAVPTTTDARVVKTQG